PCASCYLRAVGKARAMAEKTLMPPDNALITSAKAPLVAYGKKDWQTLRSTLSPNIRYEEYGTDRSMRGVEEVVGAFQEWGEALPDSKATIDHTFVSGNTVVFELTWRGRHDGTLQTPSGPIAPTYKEIEVPACQLVEVENARPVSVRHYFDMNTILQQLGVQA